MDIGERDKIKHFCLMLIMKAPDRSERLLSRWQKEFRNEVIHDE
jgi:hypothetical protein